MNSNGDVLIGNKLFSDIKIDDRVTRDLSYCIYCKVSQSGTDNNRSWFKDIDYKIPLDCVRGSDIKQCPACKFIYILKDPTE